MTEGETLGDGILTFSDQAGTCENCESDVLADMILDRETGRSYWFCPNCGAGNRRL